MARGGGRGAEMWGGPVPSTELTYKLNNWEAGKGCTRCGGLKKIVVGWVGGPGLEKGEGRVWGPRIRVMCGQNGT